MLCVPEVMSLQACVFPHHTPHAPDPQPSHLSPPATGSANPKPCPGRCQSSVGFSHPIPISWTAPPSSEQGFSSSLVTSSSQLRKSDLHTGKGDVWESWRAPDSSKSRPCRAPRATSPVCPSIPPRGSAQLQGTGLLCPSPCWGLNPNNP